jgi:hypothetical protein
MVSFGISTTNILFLSLALISHVIKQQTQQRVQFERTGMMSLKQTFIVCMVESEAEREDEEKTRAPTTTVRAKRSIFIDRRASEVQRTSPKKRKERNETYKVCYTHTIGLLNLFLSHRNGDDDDVFFFFIQLAML